MMKTDKIIALITPISHLKGVDKLLKSKGLVYYLESGTKYEVRSPFYISLIYAFYFNI